MKKPRKKSSSSTIAFALTLGIMVGVLCVALFLIRKSDRRLDFRAVSFDPEKCVRLKDISRVYRIRIRPDNPRFIWFATAEGIRVLDTLTVQWTRYGMDHGLATDETVSDICFADSVPFVGTWRGAQRFNRKTGRFETIPLCSGNAYSRVLALQWDPQSGLYISVDGRGLFRLARGDTCAHRIPVPGVAATDRITCIAVDRGMVIIGVEGRRLLQLDPSTGRFSSFIFGEPPSEKTFIWDILRRGDLLWVATSDDGLWHKSSEEDTLRRLDGFPGKGGYAFAPERDGFWCGTPFGLYRYFEENDIWLQHRHPEEKSPTDFQVLTIANAGSNLWYGSMDLGAGFLKKMEERQPQWRPMRAGLAASNVAALVADSSRLWTAYGYQGEYLDRFSVADLQYDRNYGFHDNLIDPHVQYLRLAGPRLYFGGYRGFGYIDLSAGIYKTFVKDSNFAGSDVVQMVPEGQGAYLLASLFGVMRYDSISDTAVFVENTTENRITWIHVDDSLLWIGTMGRGVRAYHRTQRREGVTALESTRRVVGIFALPSSWGPDSLLAVTKRSGCHVFSKQSGASRRLEIPGHVEARMSGEPYADDVFACREIDGRIWMGTREDGCIVFDPQRRAWSIFSFHDGLVSNQVRSLYDTDDYCWVGCYGGVNRIDKEYLESTLFDRE